MKARQRRPGRGTSVPPVTVPVVVTLDADGRVVDIVGDVDPFVGEDGTVDSVIATLSDLTCGEGGAPETLVAVELSSGRFADIHILSEDDLTHFVLLDVSEPMCALRGRQQVDNEAELEQQRVCGAMGRDADGAGRPESSRERKVFRQSMGLLKSVSMEMREPLSLLSGHTRMLARRFRDDPGALRSVAAMQHAVMRLDTLSSNALIGLGELSMGRVRKGLVDLQSLAGFLQDAFSLQAEMRGIGFEVCTPGLSFLVEADDLALRRLLVNLVVFALDDMAGGLLRVSLSAGAKSLEVELEAEPAGLSAERFGELVTTADLLGSNVGGSLVLAASQCLLQRLDATVELVERREGGHLLWFRVPMRPAPADGANAAALRDGPGIGDEAGLVAVCLDDAGLAGRLLGLLGGLGVPVVELHGPRQVEALLHEGGLRALVLSPSSAGDAGGDDELLAISGGHALLLVQPGDAGDGHDSWVQDGRVIRVSAGIGDDALKEVLAALLTC